MKNVTSLTDQLPGSLQENVSLAGYTTLRMGGAARYFWRVESVPDLAMGISWLTQEGIPWFALGGGSNVLVSSAGFPGVVVRLGKSFAATKIKDQTLTAGTRISFPRLLQVCADSNLGGLEFLVGVPAELGGAIAMNFGAFGYEIGERILSVKVVTETGEIRTLDKKDCCFVYRKSIFQEKPWLVVEGILSLDLTPKKIVMENIHRNQEERLAHQPLSSSSCGCLFKNPPNNKAGILMDQAGCKGLRKGGALISTQHANFLLNDGTATPEDAYALLLDVQHRVQDKFGIQLEPEARLIGFPSH